QVREVYKTQNRLQIAIKFAPDWECRSRAEFVQIKSGNLNSGFMISQDIHFSPIGSPWTIRARAALFDTGDYISRIYSYEQDLLGQYSVPSFRDEGTRNYILIRYKGFRNITVEAKLAETRYRKLTEIG